MCKVGNGYRLINDGSRINQFSVNLNKMFHCKKENKSLKNELNTF